MQLHVRDLSHLDYSEAIDISKAAGKEWEAGNSGGKSRE